jgi:WXG100 family type VII secretion target
MGRTIRVHPAQLRSAADAIGPGAEEYRKLCTQLYNDVTAMKGWQGIDQQTFLQQIEGFREDFEAMAALMEAYAVFLREAAQEYNTRQNQAATKALFVGFGGFGF